MGTHSLASNTLYTKLLHETLFWIKQSFGQLYTFKLLQKSQSLFIIHNKQYVIFLPLGSINQLTIFSCCSRFCYGCHNLMKPAIPGWLYITCISQVIRWHNTKYFIFNIFCLLLSAQRSPLLSNYYETTQKFLHSLLCFTWQQEARNMTTFSPNELNFWQDKTIKWGYVNFKHGVSNSRSEILAWFISS